ncbi:Uu.00g124040.m01.CDS01 [Anthostomella pinea]|uniref:Transcription factor BYE1 n=1 Tax=Anthostomella pinea TaxID=933095 RepID=A0AAI8YHG4_9PEZI|nr:Uu.00g124040.m01.CDS01 [Anthostomella pinea]
MSGEPEPRRSVRATKGQHTKAFDQLENGPEPSKRRQSKKGGKKATEKEEKPEDKQEDDEEIIRCICGATTQDDDDANEPWIACDKCGAWQHNVCVGMSVFTEDLTKDYFCEQCAPEDHKQTLEAMKRGERPWEDRRHKYEEDKKRKKGGKKGKGKRPSDQKERASPAASSTKAKPSPTPDLKKEEAGIETPAKGKRKSQDQSQGPPSKLRKVTEKQAVVATPTPKKAKQKVSTYTAPDDIPAYAKDMEEGPRKQAVFALKKSLVTATEQANKKGMTPPVSPTSDVVGFCERVALELERAFYDSHPIPSQSAAQLRTLIFSLKNNTELACRVLDRSLAPPDFVVMTGDALATKELQRENAEMKARAEKQSILVNEDGPRVRKTHKGEEVVGGEDYDVARDNVPSHSEQQSVRTADARPGLAKEASPSSRDGDKSATENARRTSTGPLRVDTQPQQSPKPSDFDIGKVFSSVRSPSASHQRRASTQIRSVGPGEDADVDRLLQDEGNDSPPYSPTDDVDPDVIWRGPLTMTNVADIPTVAKYVGGADLSKVRGIPWKDLIPPLLTVAGRIPEEKAVPYLCGLRYNNQIDLVITSLSPAHPDNGDDRKQFTDVIDYFLSKKRYGVVGERRLGNVRDTYLVPVSAGDGPIPEPMQNIGDHLIPLKRTEPMLLVVFVVRDEKRSPIPLEQLKSEIQQTPLATQAQATPVPPPRHPSMSGPAWSPATPQSGFASSGFPQPHYSQTPIPPPKIPGQPTPPMPPRLALSATPTPAGRPMPPVPGNQDPSLRAMREAQAEGEMKARQVLGPLFGCSSVIFLLPHAARMKEGEWNAVRRCLEREPRAREDLQLLSKLLTEDGNEARKNGQPPQTIAASPSGVVQTTLAAATASIPDPPAQAPQPKA